MCTDKFRIPNFSVRLCVGPIFIIWGKDSETPDDWNTMENDEILSGSGDDHGKLSHHLLSDIDE